MRTPRFRSPRNAQGGFSLIEVLIAILVLGVGLLGFALLQTMNVRFVQSANYRTQATNLTYEMLDQLRMNRSMAPSYVGDYTATTAAKNCLPPVGNDIGKDAFTLDWTCRLGKALGDGATAKVARAGTQYTVSVTWGDERWNADASDTTFSAGSRL
ncbi:type IV pilus modification protein PilV [Stenotrophomonas maltophilia]|uniref:type IV pilus modification protein PilV n=1 Tax=Pseudomonadota TaxID=1224 RepID=UPI0006AC77BD|nr:MULTISPECIES: type IV pilus modification protein PilV [Stenotrophomonas]KOQ70768.1 pilus assembly protein PilV [Stenotrophomonas maltophilia]MBA0221245.1 type IV pilus modification protein PilV [Stenotrophomonas maltophilia]MBE5268765.1 type IV pilus modification protein PilV [Stenotrophomonas sp. B2]MBH1663649.1 type IV pilus modification protein PilV [Stenotrophomonas maltophilia]MBH1835679.1 type IV pilus modification protein PilV [Stenotrophomonas maltophilia]